MNPPFEPANDLERALVAALRNQLPVTTFVQTLLTAKVYVLTDKDIRPGAVWDPSVAPMVLASSDKTPFLAIFTAPERSSAWARRQTTFGFGVSTDFIPLLKGMAPDLGIVINPGLQAGFELQPATVAQLRAQAQ